MNFYCVPHLNYGLSQQLLLFSGRAMQSVDRTMFCTCLEHGQTPQNGDRDQRQKCNHRSGWRVTHLQRGGLASSCWWENGVAVFIEHSGCFKHGGLDLSKVTITACNMVAILSLYRNTPPSPTVKPNCLFCILRSPCWPQTLAPPTSVFWILGLQTVPPHSVLSF